MKMLEENVRRLNEKYNSRGIELVLEGDVIRIVEDHEGLWESCEDVIQELRYNLKARQNEEKEWYVRLSEVEFLKKTLLKFKPSRSLDELKVLLQERIDLLDDARLRVQIMSLLIDNEFYYTCPAARTHHHNYEGGLLEHTIQTLDLALRMISVCSAEVPIDQDLLIAGCILHDIGKINCYEIINGKIELTDIQFEQYHIVNGIKLVSQNIDHKKLDGIIHIIASHHNLKEWGSPVEPRTPEAWIVHFAENLSSKILG